MLDILKFLFAFLIHPYMTFAAFLGDLFSKEKSHNLADHDVFVMLAWLAFTIQMIAVGTVWLILEFMGQFD